MGSVGNFGGLWRALDDQRHRFFLFSPIALGGGIGCYFAWPSEPEIAVAVALLVAMLVLRALCPAGSLARIMATALVFVALGGLSAKLRVEFVRAPVLKKSLHFVEVKGWVERAESKAPRGQRLTIAVESLGDVAPEDRPRRVRVRTMKAGPGAKPGDFISVKATLSPPAKPAIPGGFDFARSAWFEGLGGVGYSLSAPVVDSVSARGSLAAPIIVAIESVRRWINTRIMAALPNETGAIATALITGERGGITKETNDAYKNSGLFHILSISGLHMVVMAGAVFYSVRLLLACVPFLALNFAIKKWSAVAGIFGTLGYLAISGGSFATVRSALMILVMFAAMLLERPALALRNVALAAFGILLFYPESLFDAGFQMSFAAVTALIAAYEEVRRRSSQGAESHFLFKFTRFFGGIIATTLIASIAVAPFAAYQFHQSQQYAVISNLIAIPICNIVVMPAALVALVLMPFGLEILGLWPMALGIDAMTWCANAVASVPGAVGYLPAMPPSAFFLMLAGGIWLALWQAPWRLVGVAMFIGGIVLAPFLPRPDVLIARQGQLVAVRGPDGRLAALPARQAKYELERWLEHDGDKRKAAEAGNAAGFTCDASGCVTKVKGALVSVARHPSALADDCARARILILNVPRPKGCDGPETVIDVFDVYDKGTHALYIDEAGANGGPPAIRIDTVAAHRGDRPWSHLPDRPSGARHLRQPRLHDGTNISAGDKAPNANGSTPAAARLPAFAGRPEWLSSGPPRADVEDDDAEGEVPPTSNAARTSQRRAADDWRDLDNGANFADE